MFFQPEADSPSVQLDMSCRLCQEYIYGREMIQSSAACFQDLEDQANN